MIDFDCINNLFQGVTVESKYYKIGVLQLVTDNCANEFPAEHNYNNAWLQSCVHVHVCAAVSPSVCP